LLFTPFRKSSMIFNQKKKEEEGGHYI